VAIRQIGLGIIGGPILNPESSRFLRTTSMLEVRSPLAMQSIAATVRFIDKQEVSKLENLIRKRNIFARHSSESNFYLQRIREFADRSVIEVVRPGTPHEVADEAGLVAATVERVVMACSVLYTSRTALHKCLGVTEHREEVLDFILGPGFGLLHSSSKRGPTIAGLPLDGRFVRRFARLSLETLVKEAVQPSELGGRLRQGLQWMIESRTEPSIDGAVVKTAIALESLLGANDTEPLRRSLSERAAFLLSDDPAFRFRTSRVIKEFYDARSRLVHGSQSRRRKPVLPLLEAADRLTLMLAMTLSANAAVFAQQNGAAKWVDNQRWGATSPIARPFRARDLARALSLTDNRPVS
jgi:hypothetical protein